jgi:hypothetical protein
MKKCRKSIVDVRRWAELGALYKLSDVKAMIQHVERERAYHKAVYEKRAAILAHAKEAGLYPEEIEQLIPIKVKKLGWFKRLILHIRLWKEEHNF